MALDPGARDAIDRAAKVYCHGDLLDAVQRSRLFPDSKHFVDMPLRREPEEVLKAFMALSEAERRDVQALRSFVEGNFEEPGADLLPHVPADWPSEPPLRDSVADPALQKLLGALHGLWPTLCRTTAPRIREAPQRTTALPRRHPVVLPGGRFRETYYWDSFWIVEGLLASGMTETARGLVQNLLDDVANFGFVPNGGRIYYLNRSQPPLLCEMVASVARAMGALAQDFLAGAVPLLQREHDWWMSGEHAVAAGGSRLNRHWADWRSPRPESYREDVETAGGDGQVYQEIASAAETGWDFSSRWSRAGSRIGGNFSLREMDTTHVLPVDLNSILYRAELTLAALSEAAARQLPLAEVESALAGGQSFATPAAAALSRAAEERKAAIGSLLWRPELGRWTDAWLPAGAGSEAAATPGPADSSPTLADFAAPLWAGLAAPGQHGGIVAALRASKLLGVAGAATTVKETGQQWDAPNAWPPLQAMLIEGLRRLDASSGGPALAAELAQQWVGTCYAAWRDTGFMHEKYNAFKFGSGGSGGEYEPQVGFGWSNGVVLQLLRDYGSNLTAPTTDHAGAMPDAPPQKRARDASVI